MGKKTKLKILVACHKEDPNIREDEFYMPIQVGKALHPELDLGYQCDNEGDNISSKNGSYCELTAIYWAWKNLKDVDYIGLAHYRRYFDFESTNPNFRYIDNEYIKNSKSLDPSKLKLNENDVILPYFWREPFSYLRHVMYYVNPQDLYILYKVLDKYYPPYAKIYEKYMTGNKRTAFNMFIMSKRNFDKYCEWLFDVLGKVEARIKPSDYTSFKRVFGFMGELLLPVFCIKNNLNIKEKRIAINTDDKYKNHSYMKRAIKNLIYNISYRLGNFRTKKTLYDKYWEMYLKLDNIEI